jgi:hypothetical protein
MPDMQRLRTRRPAEQVAGHGVYQPTQLGDLNALFGYASDERFELLIDCIGHEKVLN